MAAEDLPPTRFARSGDVSIAYQVWGEGPVELVFITGIIHHLEATHEFPGVTDFFRKLGRFSRAVVFDKRGQGLSDRLPSVQTMDERAEDVRAVMNAAGMKRAVIVGYSEGASLAAWFAAFHPDYVSHLVLMYGMPKFSRSEDYPYAPTEEQIRKGASYYTSGRMFKAVAPSWASDPMLSAQAARHERLSCSPGNFKALIEMNLKLDARHILPEIRVPTLVLHNAGDPVAPVEGGRYFAEHIPGARLIEYEGADHFFTVGDYDARLADIEEFVTGTRREIEAPEERILATVLFTDIVESTDHARRMGDAAWRRVLDEHDRIVRRLVEQGRGRVVKTTGDGVLALFDGPGRAIRCALSLEPALARLQISARAGLHTGEVIDRDRDVTGIAVNAAARVMAEAGAGEVLVSRVVVDLVAGSGVEFESRGEVELKGLPGPWRLYAASL